MANCGAKAANRPRSSGCVEAAACAEETRSSRKRAATRWAQSAGLGYFRLLKRSMLDKSYRPRRITPRLDARKGGCRKLFDPPRPARPQTSGLILILSVRTARLDADETRLRRIPYRRSARENSRPI